MATPLLSRRLLYHLNATSIKQKHLYPNISYFSTKLSSTSNTPQTHDHDISKYLTGVTNADVESNPILAEYLAANIPGILAKGGEKRNPMDDILDANPHFAAIIAAEEDQLKVKKIKKTRHGLERKREIEQGVEGMSESVPDMALHNKLNIRPLFGYTRDKVTEEGTRRCYTLRDEDLMIPGILYGSDPTDNIPTEKQPRVFVKTPWSEIQRELDLYTYHHFESRVYDLTVYENEDHDSGDEGTVYRVLPRDVQFHPVQHKLYCCNYLRYYPGRPIKIPIVYINEEDSAALKRGGFIAPINRYVSCIVEDGVPIPDGIELDCTGIQLKDVLRMERIVFPEGVSLSKSVDRKKFLVGTVFGRRSDMDDEKTVEESKPAE